MSITKIEFTQEQWDRARRELRERSEKAPFVPRNRKERREADRLARKLGKTVLQHEIKKPVRNDRSAEEA